MAAEQDAGGSAFARRLEKWTRDSADLQSTGAAPNTPEEAARKRYERSRTRSVALPHPALSPAQYDALGRRRSTVLTRLTVILLAMPVVVTLAVLVGPVAAQVALWALLVPLTGAAAHQSATLARIEQQRHLRLTGGLADAWSDWGSARDHLDELGTPTQARAAIGANEARMQALVVGLSRSGDDTAEHQASRAWVYDTAAKAVALAQAERAIAAGAVRELALDDLRLAPDGDTDSLDRALATARALEADDEPPALDGPDE